MTIDPKQLPALLMAYADGELDDLAARRVERAIAQDPALAEKVAAHRRLRETLSGHFGPVAQAPVPGRLSAMLAGAPEPRQDNVVPFAPRTARLRFTLTGLAMAASLALGLVIGPAFDRSPVATRDGALVAHGALASVLDRQLASADQTGAATRIGLTFRDQGGAVCRTFEGASMAGIACRGADRWRLRTILGGDGQRTDYRQAGSAETLAAAQAMMAGEPFDAAAEQAAQARGWK